MLSRAANSVYWLSRYLERAENVARFIEVNQSLALGFGEGLNTQWAPLIHISGDEELFLKHYDNFTEDNVLRFLAVDERNPNSILSCLMAARENARMVRETISAAMWEEINKFYHAVKTMAERPHELRQPHEFLSLVKRSSYTVIGATDVTMDHGEAWNFTNMGRLMERADKTSRLIDVKYFILLPQPDDVGTPLDVVQWSALLNSTTALTMYRRRHGRIKPDKVLDFLILDRFFPRSMRFCLLRAETSLHEITGSARDSFSNRVEQLMGRLRSELDYISIEDIISSGLHEFIDGFQVKLNAIGTAVSECFFVTNEPNPDSSDSGSQTQTQSAE